MWHSLEPMNGNGQHFFPTLKMKNWYETPDLKSRKDKKPALHKLTSRVPKAASSIQVLPHGLPGWWAVPLPLDALTLLTLASHLTSVQWLWGTFTQVFSDRQGPQWSSTFPLPETTLRQKAALGSASYEYFYSQMLMGDIGSLNFKLATLLRWRCFCFCSSRFHVDT